MLKSGPVPKLVTRKCPASSVPCRCCEGHLCPVKTLPDPPLPCHWSFGSAHHLCSQPTASCVLLPPQKAFLCSSAFEFLKAVYLCIKHPKYKVNYLSPIFLLRWLQGRPFFFQVQVPKLILPKLCYAPKVRGKLLASLMLPKN